MNRIKSISLKAFVGLLILIFSTTYLSAQEIISADSVITSLYESLNYDGGNLPDTQKCLSFFTEDAQLKWVMSDTILTFSPKEYFKGFENQIEEGIILKAYENEIAHQSQQFGKIAHFFSSYKTRVETPNGTINKSGVNSIQLVKIKNQWKVSSLTWYDKDESNALPTLLSDENGKDRMAVEIASLNYIESIYDMDTAKLNSVSPNLQKLGYYLSRKDSSWSFSPMTYQELEHTVKTYNRKQWIPESAPKRVEILDLDEKVANVKVYAIWGFDYLLLSKSDAGDWKIQQILWQSYTFQNQERMVERMRNAQNVLSEKQ